MSTRGRPLRMLLCTPILHIRLHWKVWSPNLSGWRPQGQKGFVVLRSFRLMHISKIQGGNRLEALLRHMVISGYDICGDRMLGRRWRCSGACVANSWCVALWRYDVQYLLIRSRALLGDVI